jgi:hypothetical protein
MFEQRGYGQTDPSADTPELNSASKFAGNPVGLTGRA